MKVKDLIKRLEQFDPEVKVTMQDDIGWLYKQVKDLHLELVEDWGESQTFESCQYKDLQEEKKFIAMMSNAKLVTVLVIHS